jgi:hypothetical protein
MLTWRLLHECHVLTLSPIFYQREIRLRGKMNYQRQVVRKYNRIKKTKPLTSKQLSNFRRELYNSEVDDLRFYIQDQQGCPTKKVPTTLAGEDLECTLAFQNDLEADAWIEQDRPKTFKRLTWPPETVADLLGCSSLGDVCVLCATAPEEVTQDEQYEKWLNKMHDFWLDNLQINRCADGRGFGLYTHNAIPAGTVIGEYTGMLLPVNEDSPDAISHYQCDIEIGPAPNTKNGPQAKAWIDATYKGSIFRFMNHCCIPNAKIMQGRCGIHHRIVYVYTLETIGKIMEIDIDYGAAWWAKSKDPCLCGEEDCNYSKEARAKKARKESKMAKEAAKPKPRIVDRGIAGRKRQEAEEPAPPRRKSPRLNTKSVSPGRQILTKKAAPPSKVTKRPPRHGPIEPHSGNDEDELSQGQVTPKKVTKKIPQVKSRS